MKLFIDQLAKTLKSLFSRKVILEVPVEKKLSIYYKYILAIRENHFTIFERDNEYRTRRKLSGLYYRIWNWEHNSFYISEVTKRVPLKIPETHNPELIYLTTDEELFEVLENHNKLVEWMMTRIII